MIRIVDRALFGVALSLIAAAPSGSAEVTSASASVEVRFLTNRNLTLDRQGAASFGNELGDLTGGRCRVSVAERERDTRLEQAQAIPVEDTLKDLGAYRDRGLVFYIHGYYEDFDRACRRAAIFQHRLGLDRGFLLFTWPANSTPLTYGADVEDLIASVPEINRALMLMGERIGRNRISIVGHSLGNRGLIRALGKPNAGNEKFRDLILVAADVDRSRFREVLPLLNEHVAEVTVLVSDRDLPLRASQVVNRAPRLGQASEMALEWMDGLAVIDVSDTESTHLSGHIYHLRNDQVLDRIRRVLQKRGRRNPGTP